jgi:hypothetical protein
VTDYSLVPTAITCGKPSDRTKERWSAVEVASCLPTFVVLMVGFGSSCHYVDGAPKVVGSQKYLPVIESLLDTFQCY